MAMHELDITIQPNGQVKLHIQGVKGAACDQYVKLLEEILSSDADQIERTGEFYEPPVDVEIDLQQQL